MITRYDCSNELYTFIDGLIDDNDDNGDILLNNDDFTVWPGITFVFLWVNWIISFVLTFYFNKKKNKKALLLQVDMESPQNLAKNNYARLQIVIEITLNGSISKLRWDLCWHKGSRILA